MPRGRPLGAIDKRHQVSAEFARRIVDDAEYRNNLLDRARKGTLPPQVEQLLWYYAFGRPVETIAMSLQPADDYALDELTEDELAARAETLAKTLRGVVVMRQLPPKKDGDDDIH